MTTTLIKRVYRDDYKSGERAGGIPFNFDSSNSGDGAEYAFSEGGEVGLNVGKIRNRLLRFNINGNIKYITFGDFKNGSLNDTINAQRRREAEIEITTKLKQHYGDDIFDKIELRVTGGYRGVNAAFQLREQGTDKFIEIGADSGATGDLGTTTWDQRVKITGYGQVQDDPCYFDTNINPITKGEQRLDMTIDGTKYSVVLNKEFDTMDKMISKINRVIGDKGLATNLGGGRIRIETLSKGVNADGLRSSIQFSSFDSSVRSNEGIKSEIFYGGTGGENAKAARYTSTEKIETIGGFGEQTIEISVVSKEWDAGKSQTTANQKLINNTFTVKLPVGKTPTDIIDIINNSVADTGKTFKEIANASLDNDGKLVIVSKSNGEDVIIKTKIKSNEDITGGLSKSISKSETDIEGNPTSALNAELKLVNGVDFDKISNQPGKEQIIDVIIDGNSHIVHIPADGSEDFSTLIKNKLSGVAEVSTIYNTNTGKK